MNKPDTHEMVIVHRVFRRCFAEMPALVRGVRPGDTARAVVVVAHIRDVTDALHHHHTDEDTLLWPPLLQRVDIERPLVLRMEEQHQRLAELIGRVRAHGASFERSARPGEREQLAGTLDALLPLIEEHLDDEERDVLPLVEERLTVAEWKTLADRGREHLSKSQMLVQLGYLLDACDDEEAVRFLATLPLPARIAWRVAGRRAYAKQRRTVSGGAR